MNTPQSQSFEDRSNRRILVVDDDPSIQEDYRKILAPAHATPEIDRMEAEIFGASDAASPAVCFELDHATQAEEALRKVADDCLQQRRYAMAFMDVRMPPGMDGIQATRRLWTIDPHIQVVICSAYSDHTWDQIVSELGHSDQFLVLRKPFEAIEVRQLALAMTTKWNASRDARRLLRELQDRCEALTRQLQLAGDRGIPLVTALPA